VGALLTRHLSHSLSLACSPLHSPPIGKAKRQDAGAKVELKVERPDGSGDFKEVSSINFELYGNGSSKVPNVRLTTAMVKQLGLTIKLNHADGTHWIRVQEDEVEPGEEVLAYYLLDDFKLIICGPAAQLMGTDRKSVAGCRLRLVAC
jgi:hypothetical protein